MRAAAVLIAGVLAWTLGAAGGVSPARAGLSPSGQAAIGGIDHRSGPLREARAGDATSEVTGRQPHRYENPAARLAEVQERLAQGEAQYRAIGRRAGELGREIEKVDGRRDRIATALRGQRQQIEALERELDHAVPRLLARLRELRNDREITAQAVAGLAALSRNVELDGTAKARLLAISPVILERLSTVKARADALRGQSEAIAARHRQARSRASAMVEQLERARRERSEKRQARDRALARLPELQAGLAILRAEQQTLSRRVLAMEAARAVRAGVRADDPALDKPGLGAADRAGRSGDAIVRALMTGRSRLARGVDGVQPATPQLVARIPDPDLDMASLRLASRAAPRALPPVGSVDATLRGDLEPVLPDVTRWAAPLADRLDAAAWPTLSPSGGMAHVALSRVDPAVAPIVLIPDRVLARLETPLDNLDGPGIAIPALPGQPVAAPEDGRIVFAGAFRSYGLLLIIAHEREYHTLLWGFSELEVKVGDQVRTGQVVGVMSGQGTLSPRLHVELRRNGRPVDPLPWLAANTSKVRG